MQVKANLYIKEGTTSIIILKAINDIIEGDNPNTISLIIAYLYKNDY